MKTWKPKWVPKASVQTMGERATSFGRLTYLRIYRDDDKPMSWREVWETFQNVYPGRWAIEMFPPESELVDEANVYHLFMLPEGDEPAGVNIRFSAPLLRLHGGSV